MHTMTCENYLSFQYLVEQLHHRGFKRNRLKSDDNVNHYECNDLPTISVRLNTKTYDVDVYKEDQLLMHDDESANVIH